MSSTPFAQLQQEARFRDLADPLASFRQRFAYPSIHPSAIYFTGNSLGLMPLDARQSIEQELNTWSTFGVEGHFEGAQPWVSFHEPFAHWLAPILGAEPQEVVAMGSLTANLHFLMASFYRPSSTRFKILCEGSSFPSDFYALDSQAKWHGFNPKEAVVELHPRSGEHVLRTEDVVQRIHELGSELALVLLGGVNYLTGQFFDLKNITAEAHKVGAVMGTDLAHAVGNVPLNLHDWNIDFAAWCSYKYLNSGPGATAGIFVHERHLGKNDLPRLEGWWGNRADTRFLMGRHIQPAQTAEAWQLSNAPVLNMAAQRASLQIFADAGQQRLHQKRESLVDFFLMAYQALLQEVPKGSLDCLTPTNPAERGCQSSLVFPGRGKSFFEWLSKAGVIADWREPNVVRIAPVPLYNTHSEVWNFLELVRQGLHN